jgi:hypothetical protein
MADGDFFSRMMLRDYAKRYPNRREVKTGALALGTREEVRAHQVGQGVGAHIAPTATQHERAHVEPSRALAQDDKHAKATQWATMHDKPEVPVPEGMHHAAAMIETRGVLGGAYRGGAKEMLTHAVAIKGGYEQRVLCGGAKLDNIADAYSHSDPNGASHPPTCTNCQAKLAKLQPAVTPPNVETGPRGGRYYFNPTGRKIYSK